MCSFDKNGSKKCRIKSGMKSKLCYFFFSIIINNLYGVKEKSVNIERKEKKLHSLGPSHWLLKTNSSIVQCVLCKKNKHKSLFSFTPCEDSVDIYTHIQKHIKYGYCEYCENITENKKYHAQTHINRLREYESPNLGYKEHQLRLLLLALKELVRENDYAIPENSEKSRPPITLDFEPTYNEPSDDLFGEQVYLLQLE